MVPCIFFLGGGFTVVPALSFSHSLFLLFFRSKISLELQNCVWSFVSYLLFFFFFFYIVFLNI